MACAEVMLAGETGGDDAKLVFWGLGFGAFIKFIIGGIKAVPGEITIRFKGYTGELGTEISPALIGVGYICGPKIAFCLFAGGMISWMVFIPLIILFGGDTILYPGTKAISEIYMTGGASAIWSTYIRYIGAGAVACSGIINLFKSVPIIISTFGGSIKGLKHSNKKASELRTDKELNTLGLLLAVLVIIILIWLLPVIPVNFLGAVIIAICGLFFAIVSSRMVGLIGGSNNPVSGMTIATLLIATIILKATGNTGIAGMVAAITIGSIICIIASVAGDTSQDLKTGKYDENDC